MKNRIPTVILASCLITGILSQTVCGAGLSMNLLSAALSSLAVDEDSLFNKILQETEPTDEYSMVNDRESECSFADAPEEDPPWETQTEEAEVLIDIEPQLSDINESPITYRDESSFSQDITQIPEEEIEILPEEELPEENDLALEPELIDELSEDLSAENELVESDSAEQLVSDEDEAEAILPEEDDSEEYVSEEDINAEDAVEEDMEEDSEDEEEGGYVFEGYLEEGIPNYIWEGKGRPSILGAEITIPEDPELPGELLSSALEESITEMIIPDADTTELRFTGISPTSQGGNYLANTPRKITYHGNKKFSPNVESSMKDGLHTIAPGKVRAYLGGRYFIDGGFALDGKVYYADENGLLISGWLKTLGDASITDANSVINDNKFSFRFFSRASYEMITGRKKIEGLWHYFRENGIMARDCSVSFEGNYYYSDQYGICEQVKLRYGNTVISESNQNNNAYYAKNMVNAVDVSTFSGQKGEYSFRPKWYSGVSALELFGFSKAGDDGSGYYCTLPKGSFQGNIGCIYRNVGRYNGRELDLKVIVTGYDAFEFCGDKQVGFFYVQKDAIGLNAVNTKNLSADMIFLDHETGQETKVKGYATFADIDIGQSVSILSPVDELYVDKNCVLYKDPNSNTFTSPFVAERVGNAVNDPDREYWVQANFTGSRLSIRIGNAYEQYVFAESGLDIAGESRNVWAASYTGNPDNYTLFSSKSGKMFRSWQGIYYKRLGRVSIPPVSKTVSDEDEVDVAKNRLHENELRYTYTLSHNVPGENEEFYYDSYLVSDEFEEGLDIDEKGIFVTTDNEDDVTGLFDITVDGRRVEFRAHSDILKTDSFYDNNYNYHIPVVIKEVEALKNKDENDYIIYNECTAKFSRLGSSESTRSNMTETRIRIPLSFGSITITKRISEADIVWAHGNPTFMFRAEGEDEKGNAHRYEEFVCFRKGGYSLSGGGFAEVSVTISHVPCGIYRVTELPVMDYYLTGAEATTKNMLITAVGEPGKGKDPSLIAYGTGTLTREEPDAGIIFYDTKGNYSGYRHTDVVCNTLPLVLE